MGVSECDNMLMLLGISETFTHTQRQIVTPMMIQGFSGEWTEHQDFVHEFLPGGEMMGGALLTHIQIRNYMYIHVMYITCTCTCTLLHVNGKNPGWKVCQGEYPRVLHPLHKHPEHVHVLVSMYTYMYMHP